jgi:hypothetical protein
MEKDACDFMKEGLVDIKDVSAADLLEAKGHLLLKKALSEIVLESHYIEIVDLANDSESQKVLHDVAWSYFSANDEHIDDFCSNSSNKLHHSHSKLREFTFRVSSAIKREAH